MPNKFISDFDAERPVMEMVYDYELSIRETRLEEIKGWRKALALGVAGLAGLSPMKAQAHGSGYWGPEIQKELNADVPGGEQMVVKSPDGFTNLRQGPSTKTPGIQMNNGEPVTVVGSVPGYTKAGGWLRVQTARGNGYVWSTVLSYAPEPDQGSKTSAAQPSTVLDPDIMWKGHEAGKAYAPGSQLSSDEIHKAAAAEARQAGYNATNDPASSFEEGWIEGYYDGHIVPGDPERATQPAPAPAQQAPDTAAQIRDLRAQVTAKWQKLPDNIKTQIKAAPDLKNLESAFNQAPAGSATKLQALQKISDYLDSQSADAGGLNLQ